MIDYENSFTIKISRFTVIQNFLVHVFISGTENVFSLSVWVLDMKRRRQLHPPHSLPLSHAHKAKLEWIGYQRNGEGPR